MTLSILMGQKARNRRHLLNAGKIKYRMTSIEFKRWRQLRDWTQEQTARQLGLSLAEIVKYETIGKIPKHIEVILEKINY